ncbi:MAG: hypothetical protein D6816_00560 [Bacteroidetes bacterium]|nr:MAG: hypothetical protein D6816_00560 [Bacteroidota bacterium]
MRKAHKFTEIDQALRLNEPVGPDHEFYTDFSGLRGEYEEKIVYRSLNVHCIDGQYRYDYEANEGNKSLVFIGGMRGTGKTSELLGYTKKLSNPNCFFVVFCRLDEDLNLNDMEYMDILILQLEKLAALLREANVAVNEGTLKSLSKWFDEQIVEINRGIRGEIGLEVGAGLEEKGIWFKLLGIFAELKASVNANTERTTSVRTVLKKNFLPFKDKFNEFVAEASLALRKAGKAQDILFIVDGLEKTLTPEIRRAIVIDESSRIRLIRANTIFILPIELMKERQKLRQLTEFVSNFPNIKIQERDGRDIPQAIDRMKEFVYKRIDRSLFDDNENDELVKRMIRYSGGNPRELLRIISYANFFADEEKGKIDETAVDKGLRKLARETAEYLTKEELKKLRELKENNQEGKSTPYDDIIDDLLEKVIIYEYNDGTYKRANPVLELSEIYQQYVGS